MGRNQKRVFFFHPNLLELPTQQRRGTSRLSCSYEIPCGWKRYVTSPIHRNNFASGNRFFHQSRINQMDNAAQNPAINHEPQLVRVGLCSSASKLEIVGLLCTYPAYSRIRPSHSPSQPGTTRKERKKVITQTPPALASRTQYFRFIATRKMKSRKNQTNCGLAVIQASRIPMST